MKILGKTYVLVKKETDLTSFIHFWERVYDNLNSNKKYRDNDFYWNNIGIKGNSLIPLKEENIEPLFLWKYGKKLFQNEINISTNVKNRINELNEFRKITKLNWNYFEDFYNQVALKCVKTKAPVISLFIVHIAQPFKYPIIDQHVVRAYKYLSAEDKSHVRPEEYIKLYKNYIDFFNELSTKSKLSFRNIDKALWAFGKFLKDKGFKNLIF